MKETPDQGFMFLLLLPSSLEVKDENGDRVSAGSGHSSRCFIHLLPFRMTWLGGYMLKCLQSPEF